MTHLIHLITVLLCVVCCLRLILFARLGATHRPWASALAYLLVVAFGTLALATLLSQAPAIQLAQGLLNLVLAAALLSVGGNVVELFRPANDNRQSFILRVLRRETWI
jgi:predicted membrane channel-forming protein YqfA (hemolysin III family)